jgi:hypothetical protein
MVSQAWEGERLGGGQPALNAVEKSAEGIVGRGLPDEGLNAAGAGCVPDGRGDCSRPG